MKKEKYVFMYLLAVLCVFIFTGGGPVLGEEAEEKSSSSDSGKIYMNIGEVVVSEHTDNTKNVDLPGSVDIIGADELKHESVDNSLELLRKLPGITIGDYGNGGVPNGFTLRGHDNNSHGNHTVVTIDGIPINSHLESADGAPDLNQLTPEEVDRVELVKGPIDARYGMWSLSGILHYYTRTHGEFNKAKIAGGSFGHKKAYASIGSEHFENRFNQVYSVEYYEAEGWRDDAERERQNAYAKWYYRPDDQIEIGLHTHVYKAVWETAGYLPESYWQEDPRQAIPTSEDDGGYKDLTEVSLHFDWRILNTMSLESKTWVICDEYSRYADWGSGQTEIHWENETYGFLSNYRYDGRFFENQYAGFDLGFDFRQFNSEGEKWNTTSRSRTSLVEGDPSNGDFIFRNYGVYAKGLYEPLPQLRLFAGIRQDWFGGDTENFETGEKKDMDDSNVTTYKFGTILTPVEIVSFYGNAATTFALPATTNKYIAGASEKDYFFWELGVKVEPFDRLLFRYAYFDQEEDGIGLVEGEWVSEGDARRKGHEAEVNFCPIEDIELFAAYTFHNAEYEDGENAGNELKNVPKYLLKVGSQYRFPWKTTEIRLWYDKTGKWFTDAENDHDYDGFETMDLKIIQSVAEYWKLTFDVKNIFDETYSEFVGFWSGENQYAGSNGRAYYLTLTYDI